MIFVDKMLYGKAHNWVIGQEQAWTTAGTYQFAVPDTGYYDVTLIGGGGSGGYPYKKKYGGGGARNGEKFLSVYLTEGESLEVTVGRGGGRVSGKGDSTKFANCTVPGGNPGGNADSRFDGPGARGYGSLGADGFPGSEKKGAGAPGYLYNDGYYGGGGSGDAASDGVSGLVVVKLVAYA